MAEKANKRELILTAAREIFGEKGYHNTTSEEIAKQAGVGKGTIYQYFESKQEIFLQMYVQYLRQYSESVSALIQEDSTFEDNMRRLIRFHLDHIPEMSQFGMQFLSKIDPSTVSKEKGRMLLQEFKETASMGQHKLITSAQQRGEIKEMDEKLIISCMMGMFLGLSHSVGMRELSEAEKEQIGAWLLDWVLHGLAK